MKAMKDEEYYGSYELRSRKVLLSHPHDLKHINKRRKIGFCQYLQDKEPDRALALFMDPPPRSATEVEAYRQRYTARSLAIATTALSEFSKLQNVEYELVDPSTIKWVRINSRKGTFAHCNFCARPSNDPSAPVELLFTESRLLPDESWPPVRFCSLGPKDSDPGVTTDCGENCPRVSLRHPTDGVYISGPHTPFATLEPTPLPPCPTVKRPWPLHGCRSKLKNSPQRP